MTAADQAAEVIDRALHAYVAPDECDPEFYVEAAAMVLAAVMPDGRTVAQTINDGATAERILGYHCAALDSPERQRFVVSHYPEAAEYLKRMGFA